MTAGDRSIRVVDNQELKRFEILVGDDFAGSLLYQLRPGRIRLIHTEVIPEVEGQGLGGRLVAGALDSARERGLQVEPLCPFAKDYIARHPEYSDLVVDGSS